MSYLTVIGHRSMGLVVVVVGLIPSPSLFGSFKVNLWIAVKK